MRYYHVLNLGAGVRSTALYLMSCERDARGYPLLDCAIFADTGEEPASVYEHLDWLKKQKGPEILVRSAGKLGDDMVTGRDDTGRCAFIPAFVRREDGKPGIAPRQCTKEYKIEVCERCIRREIVGLKPRQRMPKDVLITQYFGISTDEAGRAERAKTRFEKLKWSKPRYPLIEMDWSRKDCLAYLADRVPHRVPKSACVFCPYRTNSPGPN